MEPKQRIGEESIEEQQKIGEGSAEDRRKIGERSVEDRRKKQNYTKMNATQCSIVSMLSKEPHLTGAALAKQIGLSKRTIETNVKKLKELGVLIRHGSPKSGYWEINQ